MKRIFGPLSAPRIECTNPVLDAWRVRWDYHTDPDSGANSYPEMHNATRSTCASQKLEAKV